MNTSTVISARKLTKHYNNDFTAVNGIDFDIQHSECFGFLGPNGAGKTSTMKMITCLSPLSSGELMIDGKNVVNEQRAIKLVLGVVSQADSLDPDLTVIQNLISYGRFFNLPKDVTKKRAWESLELFQLQEKANQPPDDLSGGMRRRLLIARALLHNPKILVLDEPTTGLDPQTRLLVWEKLVYLKSQGITILLTTHYMEEAAYLCDRLVVMDRGTILVEGRPKDLIHEHVGDHVVELRVDLAHKAGAMESLQSQGLEFEDRGDSIFPYSQNGVLEGANFDGYQVIQRPGNLEDVFLRLTGRGLREE